MTKRRNHVAAICLLLLCGCGSRPASSPPVLHKVTDPSRLPAQLALPLEQRNGYLRIATKINGTDAGVFMVDTGSTENVVTSLTASELDLPVGSPGVATGIGGQAKFSYRPVQSLTVGNLRLDCNQVAELDLYTFSKSFGGIVNGIVGYSAFGHLPFTIDYQNLRLTVYNPGQFQPQPGAVAHRLWPYRGLPVIRATLGRGREVLLLVDTGAESHITLPMSCAIDWPDIVLAPVTSRGKSNGIGGSVPTVHTWLRSIQLFGLNLTGVPVNFETDRPTGPHRNVLIGRVGNRLLKDFRLTFDSAKGRVWVQWRGNQRNPR